MRPDKREVPLSWKGRELACVSRNALTRRYYKFTMNELDYCSNRCVSLFLTGGESFGRVSFRTNDLDPAGGDFALHHEINRQTPSIFNGTYVRRTDK